MYNLTVMILRIVDLVHTATFDPVLQKMPTDQQAGCRASRASPQVSDKRDDRETHSGPKGSGEIRVHRDFPYRDKQENVLLKEEMKRERMLITVSQEPAALSKLAVDQVKDKTVAVGSKDSRKSADSADSADSAGEDRKEDGKSSKERGNKSQAKSSKSAKKALAKKKLHKAKKKKSKKKKDKRKS